MATGLASFLGSAKSNHKARPSLSGRKNTFTVESQIRRSVSSLGASQKWREEGRCFGGRLGDKYHFIVLTIMLYYTIYYVIFVIILHNNKKILYIIYYSLL